MVYLGGSRVYKTILTKVQYLEHLKMRQLKKRESPLNLLPFLI